MTQIMDKVLQLVTTKPPEPPEQYVCGDCFGALFHWYAKGMVCVACLTEYELGHEDTI
jgi:hypothetical protein